MQFYKYPRKDKSIWIFTVVSEKQTGGEYVTKWKYLNAKDKPFKAYVRSVSAKEKDTDSTVYPYNEIEAVINSRPELARRQDAYIEMEGNIYAITGIDDLELYHTEMKIRAISMDIGSCDVKEYRESYV